MSNPYNPGDAHFVCQGCGRDASVHVFIAESAWKQIAPNADQRTGVLCLYCMSERLKRLGWSDSSAPASISNGPLGSWKATTASSVGTEKPSGFEVDHEGPEKALEDAQQYGIGFIVDGQRVSPERVTVCRGPDHENHEALRSLIYSATHAVLPLASDADGMKERARIQVEVADYILAALQSKRGEP